jgi:hypothetical protein
VNEELTSPEAKARRFEKAAAKSREAVRVFPDYANSVIWYDMVGPVPYEETHLSAGLIDDMEAWEAKYYAILDESYEFASRQLESDHITQGLVIARALSEEIGDVLPVEADVLGGGKTHFLTPGAGTNTEARAAFLEMRTEAEEHDAGIAAMLRSGARFDIRPSSDP